MIRKIGSKMFDSPKPSMLRAYINRLTVESNNIVINTLNQSFPDAEKYAKEHGIAEKEIADLNDKNLSSEDKLLAMIALLFAISSTTEGQEHIAISFNTLDYKTQDIIRDKIVGNREIVDMGAEYISEIYESVLCLNDEKWRDAIDEILFNCDYIDNIKRMINLGEGTIKVQISAIATKAIDQAVSISYAVLANNKKGMKSIRKYKADIARTVRATSLVFHKFCFLKICETIGVLKLRYKTQEDEKVRDTHAELDNKVFYVSDFPYDKFTEPNCRCWAEIVEWS